MPLKQVWLKFTCLLLLQSWADLLDGANYMCMFQTHLESNICCFWNALKYANISYNEENWVFFFLIRNPRMVLKAKHDFSRGTHWIHCISSEDGRRTGNLPVAFGLNVHQPRRKKNNNKKHVEHLFVLLCRNLWRKKEDEQEICWVTDSDLWWCLSMWAGCFMVTQQLRLASSNALGSWNLYQLQYLSPNFLKWNCSLH